jgi:hypothetical protein
VKTQSGDVYAGHDGNVYQHTSDGWSKWSDGGWQPVTPPTPPNSSRLQSGSGTQSGGLGASQGGSTAPTQQRLGQFGSGGGGLRQSMDGGTYQDLEQDRQARTSGLLGGSRGGGGRFRR